MSQHRRTIIALLAVLACTSLGVLFGVTFDRISFARERAAILSSARAAAEERNRQLMLVELRTRGRDHTFERQWEMTLEAIDEALLLGDTAEAAARWREAYGMAIRSGGWSQLVDVGDAALRIGDAPALQPSAAGAARQSYLTALYRARAQRSADGIGQVGEAFFMLGDRDVAERCSRLVAQLTAG